MVKLKLLKISLGKSGLYYSLHFNFPKELELLFLNSIHQI